MSRYTIYVVPRAWKEIKKLPGNMRQRVRRVVGALADDPRSPRSKKLNVPDVEPELHRLRLYRWRIVYAVTEADRSVDVLAVRNRPPYDYQDLEKLLITLP